MHTIRIKSFILLVLLSITTHAHAKQHKHDKHAHHKTIHKMNGTASWYGKNHHGKKTASGEIYNMYKLTAAHKSIKLGSIIKVTNIQNKKSVIVRLNDRGPYIIGRSIDLSYAAKTAIGMGDIAPVKIDVLN